MCGIGSLFVFMVVGIFTPPLAEKMSRLNPPSFLFETSCLAQHLHTCLRMLHLRHGSGSVAFFAPRGQASILCAVEDVYSSARGEDEHQ